MYILFGFRTVPMQFPRRGRFAFGTALFVILISRPCTSIEPELLQLRLPRLSWRDFGRSQLCRDSRLPQELLQ